MFALESHTEDHKETNIYLGSYTIIYKEKNEKDFLDWCKIQGNEKPSSNLYAFIIYNNGSQAISLFKNQKYTIRHPNGEKYKDITYK